MNEVREKIKMNKKLAGLSVLIILPIMILSLPQHAFAKASSRSYPDGYHDGAAEGSADKRIGDEYDPKCPSGHSMDYCQAFADGYDDGRK
jgi:hypothetical protein